ncbi:MAG: zinc-binding protein [Clostridia bacterium]|nr:zinc-binding protein [Clostridia bacterium]
MYTDKALTCKDCGGEFIFSASEQEFFAEKGFTNDPSRCPACRAARKQQGRGGRGDRQGRGQRTMYSATCSQCGKEALVPFQPTGEKPVYCQDCFQSRRSNNW